MNFTGRWRLRNGWEAEVERIVEDCWFGKIFVNGIGIHTTWGKNGDAVPKCRDLDLMERVGWRQTK